VLPIYTGFRTRSVETISDCRHARKPCLGALRVSGIQIRRIRRCQTMGGIVNLNWPHCDGRIWPRLKLVEVSDGSAPEDGGGVAVEFGEEYFDSGCGIE
jgi:hypothetical protein